MSWPLLLLLICFFPQDLSWKFSAEPEKLKETFGEGEGCDDTGA